jgi:hypothetical protein
MRRTLLLVSVLAFALVGCAGKQPVSKQSSQGWHAERRVSAVLVSPETTRWGRGKPLHLIFGVLNGTGTDVRLDGRMISGYNVKLFAKVPSSNDDIYVHTIMVDPVALTRADIVSLPPGRIYGSRLTIDVSEPGYVREIRLQRPGAYTFWVEFWSEGSPQFGTQELSLESNKVTVYVE